MKSKKGLSNIVSTTLIILLGLGAVAITWGFLRPAFQDSGASFQTQGLCLETQLSISKCEYIFDGSDYTINSAVVKLVRGEEVDSITTALIFEDETDEVANLDAPGILGTRDFTGEFSSAYSLMPMTLEATPVVLDDEGEEVVCSGQSVQASCDDVTPQNPACDDGQDNDGDGEVDLADYGCQNAVDDSEVSTNQCGNGIDDDSDGYVDQDDSDCTGWDDDNEATQTACNNGIDDDSDGEIDLADYGCEHSNDFSEVDLTAECGNGIDDDSDGDIDQDDAGCGGWGDDDEGDELACDNGVLDAGEVCEYNGGAPIYPAPYASGNCYDYSDAYSSGALGCSSQCQLTFGSCVDGVCGDEVLNIELGEQCEENPASPLSCTGADTGEQIQKCLPSNPCNQDPMQMIFCQQGADYGCNGNNCMLECCTPGGIEE